MPGHINFGVHDVVLESRFTRGVTLKTPIVPLGPDFRGSGMVFLALQVSGLVKLRILLRV